MLPDLLITVLSLFVNKAEKPHYEKKQKGHTLNKSKKVTLTNNIQITKKQFF